MTNYKTQCLRLLLGIAEKSDSDKTKLEAIRLIMVLRSTKKLDVSEVMSPEIAELLGLKSNSQDTKK